MSTTLADLLAEIPVDLPDNARGQITAAIERNLLANIINKVEMHPSAGDDIVYVEDFAPPGNAAVTDWTPIVAAAQASFPAQTSTGTPVAGRILFTHRPGQASKRALTGGVYPFLTPARAGGNTAIEIHSQISFDGMGNPGGNVYGISQLTFAAGLSGIAVYSENSPTAGGLDASNTRIRGLSLTGSGKTDPTPTVGVWFSAMVALERLSIQQFSSHGMQTVADVGGTPPGNSSLSFISNLDCNSNGGDGFHMSGGDANAITFLNCRTRNNNGAGIFDDSFLGNYWFGGQVANNLTWGVHATKPGGFATFISIYVESGQVHNLSGPVTALGGVLAYELYSGNNTSNAGQAIGGGFLSPAVLRSVVTPGNGFIGTPAVLGRGELAIGNGYNDDHMVFGLRDYDEASGTFPFRLKQGVGGFFWDWGNTNSSIFRLINSRATLANGFDRDTQNIPSVAANGCVSLDRGMFIGRAANMIFVDVGTAAPTSGTYKVGDRVLNSAPTAGGTEGWICTTAGTPGTWKTYGAIAA